MQGCQYENPYMHDLIDSTGSCLDIVCAQVVAVGVASAPSKAIVDGYPTEPLPVAYRLREQTEQTLKGSHELRQALSRSSESGPEGLHSVGPCACHLRTSLWALVMGPFDSGGGLFYGLLFCIWYIVYRWYVLRAPQYSPKLL